MDDSVGKDGTREVIVDDPAVGTTFTELLYFDRGGNIREKRVQPGCDNRSRNTVRGRFVHKNELIMCSL